MILLPYITFNNYKKDKEISTQEIVSKMDKQMIDKIDDYFRNLSTYTKYPLLTNERDTDFISELDIFNKTGISSVDFHKMFAEMCARIISSNQYIHSVFVFNLHGKSKYSTRESSLYDVFDPKNEKWFKDTVKNFGKTSPISTFLLPNVADMKGKPVYVFSMSRGIVDLRSSKVIGVILVNSKLSFLSDLCEKMKILPGQRLVIVDKEGNIVYDTIQSNLMKKFDNNLFHMTGSILEGNNFIKLDGVDYLMHHITSDPLGWKVINIIPLNELNENINQLKYTTTVFTVIFIIISCGFMLLIAWQIIVPIKKLALLMKLVKKGNFKVKIKSGGRDEVGQLALAFNSMTRRIEKLIEEVYLDKVIQSKLELQMLQNQINPHFLYNTLESIHMMAEINHDNETSKMVRSLGKLLKYNISRVQDRVTVKEEINHLNDYILLQKIRFDEIFDIKVNIDESINQVVITKLILQPILENAIYHGMENKGSGGLIEIYGYKKDEDVIFEIIDNGKGMNEKQVMELNENINNFDNTTKNIGLKNVNKRIKLHYGEEYGITVSSILDVGTTVKIILPIT